MEKSFQKREKRKYEKKRLLTQDELWKIIIPTLWIPFVYFCLEDWADKIDFSREPVFLDKELKRLKPRGKAKNRAVDILMRIYLKNGESKCFLLHIEVQGYYDENFEKRVFEYYYRITDLLQEPIETLAILIDDDPNWRPSEYTQSLGQTALNLKFRLFKLLDNPPPYIHKENNPFAIVFEVAWYALKQNMLKNDDDLAILKFGLIRRLLTHDIEESVIYDMLDFINIYLPFDNLEKETNFDLEIDLLIDKDSAMPTIETYRERLRELYKEKVQDDARRNAQKFVWEEFKEEREEIKKERRELTKMRKQDAKKLQEATEKRQEEAKLRQEEAIKHAEKLLTIVLRLHSHGSSIETIADIVAEPIAAVQALIDAQNV